MEIELLRSTLSSLGSLRYLGLDGMHSVGNEVVKEAAKLPNLEELSISYTQVRTQVSPPGSVSQEVGDVRWILRV